MKFNKPNNQQTAQSDDRVNSIMVVDDSKFARNILCDILRSDGFCVVAEAKNGVEAVEMARDKKPKYIFLDVEMPMMDGLGAIPKILEVNPGAHIIMCTAMGQKNIIVEAVKAGAKDYVIKPYKKENILRVLNLIIESKKKGESAESLTEEDIELDQEPDNAGLALDEQPKEEQPVISVEEEALQPLASDEEVNEIVTVIPNSLELEIDSEPMISQEVLDSLLMDIKPEETFFGGEAGGAAAEDAGMIESAAAAGDVKAGLISQEAAAAFELMEKAELEGTLELQDVTEAGEADKLETEFVEIPTDTVFMLETLEESLEEGKLLEINEFEGFTDLLGEPVTAEAELSDETVIISEAEKATWKTAEKAEIEVAEEAIEAKETSEAEEATEAKEYSETEKTAEAEETVEVSEAEEKAEAENTLTVEAADTGEMKTEESAEEKEAAIADEKLIEANEDPEADETIDTLEASEEMENSQGLEVSEAEEEVPVMEVSEAEEEAPVMEVSEAEEESPAAEGSVAEEAEEILEGLNTSEDNDLRELLEEIAELQEAADKRSNEADREFSGKVKPHKAAGKSDTAAKGGQKEAANEELINSSLDYYELSYLWKDRFENIPEEVENTSQPEHKLPFRNVVYLMSRSMFLPDMDQSQSNLLTDIISSCLSLDNRLQTDESSYERQMVSYQDGARLFTGKIFEDKTDVSAGYAMSDILKWNAQKMQNKISISTDKLSNAITQLVQGKSERVLK